VTAPASRPRPARRALDELSLVLDLEDLEERLVALPLGDLEDRTEALEAWTALPGETNLLYTPYIDLRLAHLENAQLVWDPATGHAPAALPEDADGLLVLSEGGVVGSALSDAARDAGVEFTTVTELHGRKPDAARELLETGPGLPGNDKFAQLTRALWSQGVVLDVPAGVVLAKPIVIRWVVGEGDRALITRTRVRLGDGASAVIVEELVPPADEVDPTSSQALFAGTMEVTVGDGASLQVASLQELPANVVAIQHRAAVVGEGSSLQWALAQLGGRLVRSRVDNRLVGDRSSVRQVEIVFGADEQLFDLTSYTTHVGRDTTGDLLSKAALLEKSRTYLKGLITIERSAHGTDSFLGEFGMNLSKDARSVAIPSLEIDQPDCRRAAHSSSVGPVDETQLFYLESRGIPPDEARKFIVLGFLEPVVARVPLASARDRLRDLLEAKWIAGSGGAASTAAA
jgi:Fe-S cluster assembly scaffold protein SufB